MDEFETYRSPEPPRGLDRLFWEIRRRRLIPAAGVYAVASWFLVQMVATVAPHLNLPEWTVRTTLALTVVGLPVVLGLAWIFGYRTEAPPASAPGATPSGAPVPGTPAGERSAAARDRATPSASPTAPGTRRSDYALVVLLAMAGVGLWAYRNFVVERAGTLAGLAGRDAPARVEASPRSVAVLPFATLGEDPESDYFSQGIGEEIRNALAAVPGLRVTSRTSSARYAGAGEGLRRIAAELGVGSVLEGAVQRRGDRVRVTVQLVDARSDHQIWAKTYDRELTVENLFAVEEEIARSVAAALEVRLAGEGRLVPAEPVSLEAHDLYLLGLHHWNRRTGPELWKAVGLLRRAVEGEPGYALAHAGLANCYVLLPLYAGVPPDSAMPLAKRAAERALALDEGLAEAHGALAFARTVYDWDWEGAEAGFRRALELRPSYATAHEWYGLLLDAVGRHEEAGEHVERALELDPHSLIINEVLGLHHLFTGSLEAAVEQLERTLELQPDFPLGLIYLAEAYLLTGRHEEARRTLGRWAELTGADADAAGEVVDGIADPGLRGRALGALEELEEAGAISPFRLAQLSALLGAREEALDRLLRAHEGRDFLTFLVAADPALAGLREEPEFREILGAMGLVGRDEGAPPGAP